MPPAAALRRGNPLLVSNVEGGRWRRGWRRLGGLWFIRGGGRFGRLVHRISGELELFSDSRISLARLSDLLFFPPSSRARLPAPVLQNRKDAARDAVGPQ